MIAVLTAADVKRQDAAAAARGIPVDTLMRAAGTAVAHRAIAMMGGAYGRRVTVACGKGNNGGDGLVAAQVLRERGARVTVVFAGERPSEGAAARTLDSFAGRVVDAADLSHEVVGSDLVIDAVLGVGLSRAPDGAVAAAIIGLSRVACPVLAVDVPSGVDADTGSVPGVAVRAACTVTLGGYKPGLLFAPGAAFAGDVVVADIGMPSDLASGTAIALETSDVVLPRRAVDANKYRSGAVVLVCGSRAMPGAAVLAAGACVRAGAGIAILASHPSVCSVAVTSTPELVTVPLADSPEGVVDGKDVEQILERLDKASALVVGPGLTRHPAAVEAIRALVTRTTLPLVLDADGLNAFEGDTDALSARQGDLILTPHEGEYARLAGIGVDDRLAAARSLAERSGAVVLLKGSGTVVASPDGRLAVNPTGGSGLASAGTGDVLAGILGAFLARGLEPFDAATHAAYVHGLAAHGETPTAGDVMRAIGDVLASVGSR